MVEWNRFKIFIVVFSCEWWLVIQRDDLTGTTLVPQASRLA